MSPSQHWNCAWQMRALRPMMITPKVLPGWPCSKATVRYNVGVAYFLVYLGSSSRSKQTLCCSSVNRTSTLIYKELCQQRHKDKLKKGFNQGTIYIHCFLLMIHSSFVFYKIQFWIAKIPFLVESAKWHHLIVSRQMGVSMIMVVGKMTLNCL